MRTRNSRGCWIVFAKRSQQVPYYQGFRLFRGRHQTVTREENPLYYDLISAFHRKTGIPVILNTSFNENEPIVCTPEEAVDCFQRTRMDVLAIGSFVIAEAQRNGGRWLRRALAMMHRVLFVSVHKKSGRCQKNSDDPQDNSD